MPNAQSQAQLVSVYPVGVATNTPVNRVFCILSAMQHCMAVFIRRWRWNLCPS